MLPPRYSRAGGIDLASEHVLALLLGVLGLAIFALVAVLLSILRRAVRADEALLGPPVGLFEILLVTIAVVVVHEALHGACFWFFTREPPRFGVRLLYAYASAPGWYLPRSDYLVTALAPFTVIGVIGLAVLLLLDGVAVTLAGLAVALNAAGSVGDLAIVVLVLRRPGDSLVLDTGAAVTVFGRAD